MDKRQARGSSSSNHNLSPVTQCSRRREASQPATSSSQLAADRRASATDTHGGTMASADDDPYLAELLDLTNEELGDGNAGGAAKKAASSSSQASGGGGGGGAAAAAAASSAASAAAASAASASGSQQSPPKAPSYRSSGASIHRFSRRDSTRIAFLIDRVLQSKKTLPKSSLNRHAPRDAQAPLAALALHGQAALGGRGPPGLPAAVWRRGRRGGGGRDFLGKSDSRACFQTPPSDPIGRRLHHQPNRRWTPRATRRRCSGPWRSTWT